MAIFVKFGSKLARTYLSFLSLGCCGVVLALGADIAQANNISSDTINGTLGTLNSITFISTAGIGSPINLSPNTALALTSVGNVNVKSNTSGGFKVEVESANAGALKRLGGTELMVYSLNYNDVDQGQITIKKVVENSGFDSNCADDSGCDRNVKISISQSQVQSRPAGLYSDMLTFTLTNQ
ncbi:hypothetical protein [Pseudanabaena mucicola]|uniref:Uncharacterized protein n=1 Tax=Pseudanabaena mucicola FACHB-723 TaxID=2692860 RepID=A0ABR8A0E5_9CYAN|nr:hypothetical protein [Pseudanabaena mucicola]MBD2189225.1 hypothetical protein [Pseudanabaena mucicola FACHB-723]